MNIVIVGNGTSLLSRHNGQLIDSFDDVVRFNSYSIEPYQSHVGTKTTIWYNVINFRDLSDWRMFVPYKQVVVHSWQWDPFKDALYKSFATWFNGRNGAPQLVKTARSTVQEMAKYIDSDYTAFSTGAIAIWMLTRQQPVTITGFDWWDTTKHHYNDNAPRGSLHKPVIERDLIYKLRDQQLLSFL